MSAPDPSIKEPATPTVADDWERALLDRQLEGLARLAEMGLAMADAIARRVTEDGSETTPAELHHAAMDFARVSRAMRLTYALQSRLVADFNGRPAPLSPDNDDDDEAEDAAPGPRWFGGPKANRKHAIFDAVGIVSRDAGLDGPELERLEREAVERIDREDHEGRLWALSIGEMVALICRDLGLDPDWDCLVGESWAQDEIARGPRPTSPFAGWMAARDAEPSPHAASP